MTILAISTSSNICSVALLEDADSILELNINDSKTHSENLIALIDELFTKSNLKLSDVDLIGVDSGPGSFTGIRIGISTVKGLAAPNDIPIVPISSLEALSYNSAQHKGHICSLIDARNSQVYFGLFDSEHQLCTDYIADDINNIMPIINKYNDVVFVGDGAGVAYHATRAGMETRPYIIQITTIFMQKILVWQHMKNTKKGFLKQQTA